MKRLLPLCSHNVCISLQRNFYSRLCSGGHNCSSVVKLFRHNVISSCFKGQTLKQPRLVTRTTSHLICCWHSSIACIAVSELQEPWLPDAAVPSLNDAPGIDGYFKANISQQVRQIASRRRGLLNPNCQAHAVQASKHARERNFQRATKSLKSTRSSVGFQLVT